MIDKFDVVVIGAGLAGLTTALRLKPLSVLVISPTKLGQGAASDWAQGGIAAAIGKNDSPASHLEDTLIAGAGLCNPEISARIMSQGHEAIQMLEDQGMIFDREADGSYHFGQEGAHRQPRVLSGGGDRTGHYILSALIQAARTAEHITLAENMELQGFHRSDQQIIGCSLCQNGTISHYKAAIVLASGGIGYLCQQTTNPTMAKGQGLALALASGAVLRDLEFMQYHPTALDHEIDPAPLLTEALRGAGAVLRRPDGSLLMTDLHPQKDLAPRDIVARAVYQCKLSAGQCLLDATKLVSSDGRSLDFETAFPTVWSICQQIGLNPNQDFIPVAPALHYHMGGIAVSSQGRTNLENLWACGEVSATGLHGANRLASNSLLEAVIYGCWVAEDIKKTERPTSHNHSQSDHIQLSPLSADQLTKLRTCLYRGAGLVRHQDQILAQRNIVAEMGLSHPTIHLVHTILTAALNRTESRGAHFRSDFPDIAPSAKSQFIQNISSAPMQADLSFFWDTP